MAEASWLVIGEGLIDVFQGGVPLLEFHVGEGAAVEPGGGPAEAFIFFLGEWTGKEVGGSFIVTLF